jgi:Kef-type K+ transport system membrane component KefB
VQILSSILVLDDFAIFFIILTSGLVFSEFFKRLHLPYVVALVVAGIVIGPSVLGIVELSPPLEFMGSIGIVFLMFMAGLEIRTDILAKARKRLLILVVMNATIPAFVGFAIVSFFGYEALTALVISTIFISSSVAIVVPLLEEKGFIETEIGAFIIGAVILEDICSLFFLSVVLQTADPTATLPLFVFIPLVIVSVIVLKLILPGIQRCFFRIRRRLGYEEHVVFLFAVTVAVAAYFELLGLHAIVAGFLVGLILSGGIRQEKTKNKLHAITYGLFIPIFLLQVGIETDLTVFLQLGNALTLVIAVTVGLVISKTLSGYLAGRLIKLSARKAFFVGFATTPQVSTSLAAAFTAFQLGIIDTNLQSSIVILSIVTVLLAPLVLGRLASSINVERLETQS